MLWISLCSTQIVLATDAVNNPDEFLWRGLIYRKLELALGSNVSELLVARSPVFLGLLNSCCSQQMDFDSTG